MKTFKITKKVNQSNPPVVIDFISGGTSGNDLYIVIEEKDAYDIIAGTRLVFEKSASGNSGQMIKVCEESLEVKSAVPENGYLYVYFEYLYIKPLILTSYMEIETPVDEGYNFKLYFNEPHNMLPCDIDENYKVYVRRGRDIIEFGDVAFCYPGELIQGKDIVPDYGECCDNTPTYFNYETMERNSILAKTKVAAHGDEFTPEPGDQVFFATNPYFHIVNELDDEDNEISRMELYGCSGETVSLLKYTNYMDLGVVLEQDYDAKRMFQEYQVNEQFVKKIKSTIIPDFIDFEKIKYTPAYSGDSVYLATGLTFNLHFRTRVQDRNDRYKFDPTWHLNEPVDTWNNNGVNSTPVKRKNLYADENFVNSSNLIGYLDFDDDDIYNQKNRVKQSFLRISFYDSTNPLEQNLLYYSTIFIDTGDLFGKYVKRKAWMEEASDKRSSMLTPVVWSPTGATDPVPAVTSQLIVNDEYDMTRSGEGFNLYLFKQDAPIEISEEPIYMKVEFNHAGNGRTIPLIFWRKDENNEPIKLNIGNYIKNLYIPVWYGLTDKGYVYFFEGTETERNNGLVWENDRLVLNLFEPKLELEGEQVPEPTEINTRITGQFVQDNE